jgi:hypothetical protein
MSNKPLIVALRPETAKSDAFQIFYMIVGIIGFIVAASWLDERAILVWIGLMITLVGFGLLPRTSYHGTAVRSEGEGS